MHSHTHSHTHTHTFTLTLRANQTFDIMRKEHASDVAVANANVKKLQLQVASLEKALRGKVGRGGGGGGGEGVTCLALH